MSRSPALTRGERRLLVGGIVLVVVLGLLLTGWWLSLLVRAYAGFDTSRRSGGPPTVTHVVDGDTIEVRVGGHVEKVRLLGIDTPETKDPRKPVQCFGE